MRHRRPNIQDINIAVLTKAAKIHTCKKCKHPINQSTFYINHRLPGNCFPMYNKYHKKCFESLKQSVYIMKSNRYFEINPEPLPEQPEYDI